MQGGQQQPEYQAPQAQQVELEPADQIIRNPQDQLKAALNLAQTMPPSKDSEYQHPILRLIYYKKSIFRCVKKWLFVEIDDSDPKNVFLKTQFNRDGDSYRSFITNQYSPPSEGYVPSSQYRKVEIWTNYLFQQYTKLYYGPSAIGSFYITEGHNQNIFSLGFFAKKESTGGQDNNFQGGWDSFNVGKVQIQGNQFTLTLTTTILIQMNFQSDKEGQVDLNGFLKKQKVEKRKLGKEKLESIVVLFCEMVEDLETTMRQHLQAIYIGKTREIIFSTRYENTVNDQKQRKSLAQSLKKIHLKN